MRVVLVRGGVWVLGGGYLWGLQVGVTGYGYSTPWVPLPHR